MVSFSKMCLVTACTIAVATPHAAASDVAVDQPVRNLRAEADSATHRALQSDWQQYTPGNVWPQGAQGGQGGGGGGQGTNGGGGGGGVGPDGKPFSFSWGQKHSNSNSGQKQKQGQN